MTAIQICALISLITAAAILYWTGYRGGLTDGKNDGYEDGHSDGFTMGQNDASAAYATSIEKVSTRCQRLEQILHREPQDRLDLLAIAEKLKLAADTFRAVKAETTQAPSTTSPMSTKCARVWQLAAAQLRTCMPALNAPTTASLPAVRRAAPPAAPNRGSSLNGEAKPAPA